MGGQPVVSQSGPMTRGRTMAIEITGTIKVNAAWARLPC
jgi:hypothetical protein